MKGYKKSDTLISTAIEDLARHGFKTEKIKCIIPKIKQWIKEKQRGRDIEWLGVRVTKKKIIMTAVLLPKGCVLAGREVVTIAMDIPA
jgi:hypothetical protein